jgi:zinc transport system ATP-binding protein
MSKEKCACGFHCIKVSNLSVTLGEEQILKDIDIHIHCGELTAIIGPNGAGKTTLLKAILGEIKHTGTIAFKDVHDNTTKCLNIGYVPQKLNLDKNTPTSVYDLFASLISTKPVYLFEDKKLYKEIKQKLNVFNIGYLIDKEVSNLSGGELQRVLLVLATYNVPNLLILDEPVSGVDNNGLKLFYENIDYLKKNYDLAIIVVSHDLDFVENYADNVLLLNRKIVKKGNVKEVFASKEFASIFKTLVTGDNND